MKVIITSDSLEFSFILFDTKTQKTYHVRSTKEQECHTSDGTRPKIRNFGITWNKENIFISNRKNLLIYDNQLNCVDIIRDKLDENTHQITYYKNQIIATMTRMDCVGFFDLQNNKEKYFHPTEGWMTNRPDTFEHGDEKYHINSVVCKNDLLYVMLHNRNKMNSQILILNLISNVVEKIIDLSAYIAHNIYVNDIIKTLNTKEKCINVDNQNIKLLLNYKLGKSFIRGMAGDKNKLIYGESQLKYVFRNKGGSYINLLDKNNKHVNSYLLENIGCINDIRRIDGEDFCHHNKYKFPFKNF